MRQSLVGVESLQQDQYGVLVLCCVLGYWPGCCDPVGIITGMDDRWHRWFRIFIQSNYIQLRALDKSPTQYVRTKIPFQKNLAAKANFRSRR